MTACLQSEYEAADYAIQILNEGLSRVGKDFWNQKTNVDQSLAERLAELSEAFAKRVRGYSLLFTRSQRWSHQLGSNLRQIGDQCLRPN
jgi:hypothetical protein